MRGFCAAAAGLAGLGAGLLLVQGLSAQGKAPLPTPEVKTITPVQFDEMRGGATQVDWREGYKHGRFVVLTLKNNEKVSGRVVWTDAANNKLYVRAHDGDVPMAIPFADITKSERIQLAAGKEDKGRVVPASIKQGEAAPAISMPQGPNAPEIHVVRVINGDTISEQFYSNVISHGEQEYLKKLALAEQEVARTKELLAQLNTILQNKLLLQDARVLQEQGDAIAIRLANNAARNTVFYTWWLEDPPLGINYVNWMLSPRNTNPVYYPPSFSYVRPLIQRIENEGETFNAGKITEDIEIARRSVEKAQMDVAMLRSRAVYEDGRIVAVKLD